MRKFILALLTAATLFVAAPAAQAADCPCTTPSASYTIDTLYGRAGSSFFADDNDVHYIWHKVEVAYGIQLGYTKVGQIIDYSDTDRRGIHVYFYKASGSLVWDEWFFGDNDWYKNVTSGYWRNSYYDYPAGYSRSGWYD